MTKIDKYYQITQNETQNISIYWKVAHIVLIFAATVCSYGVAYSLQTVLKGFGKNCFLYTTLVFKDSSEFFHYKNVGNFSRNQSFHNPFTSWGTPETCHTFHFAFLLICVIGLILVAFFSIVSRGGAGNRGDFYMDPWKIVIPSILISLVLSITTLILYIKLDITVTHFCEQIEAQIHSKMCSEQINEYTLIYNKHEVNVSKFIYLILRFSSLVLIFWCLLTATLVYRLIRGTDFKIIVYHLKKSQKEDDADDTDDGSDDSILDADKTLDIAISHAVVSAKSEKVKNEITWL